MVRNINQRDVQASRNFRKLIKEYQLKTGKNQMAIAEDLNTTQGNLSAYMNCHTRFTIDKLFVFSEYLGCHPTDIYEALK